MQNCSNCSKRLIGGSSSDGGVRKLDESYVFLPPRFGEASVLSRTPIQNSLIRPNHLLGESMIGIAHSDASKNVRKATRIAMHSSGRPITQPCCSNCIKSMTEMIEREIEETRDEKRAFMSLLSRLNQMPSRIDTSESQYNTEIESMERNLQLMREESAEIQQNLTLELELPASELWTRLNRYERDFALFQQDRDTAMMHVREVYHKINQVRQSNVYNEAFYIWHNGPFGTINGFRMGRLHSHEIEWNEINAAWGEAALLLLTLAKALDVTFPKYQIIPLGSFSKIKRRREPEMLYNLHGSNADNYPESKYNLGLAAWLECLAHLGNWAESQDHAIRLPYKIDPTSYEIGDLSIQFLKNDEKWTKASKFALTNLKWILAWVFKRRKRAGRS